MPWKQLLHPNCSSGYREVEACGSELVKLILKRLPARQAPTVQTEQNSCSGGAFHVGGADVCQLKRSDESFLAM